MTPPASDVVYALSRDVEEEEKAKKIVWPDTELLFGQDPDYQNDVGQIFHQIKEEVDNVLNYSKVFLIYMALAVLKVIMKRKQGNHYREGGLEK